MPQDSKYFQTTKRGEIHELKEELHVQDKAKKKDAVKKVIAAMTIGKDVSALFPDVVNCMQTTNIELKKLVYLYVIHYAKSQPDLAILAVNTFRKDASDPNALLRALAVRTMGCIRLQQITEYLLEPLRRCCSDSDPYVRKTAAVCIAKVYEIQSELVEDQGFLDVLRDLLGDANPMVVANAVGALSEISDVSGKDQLHLDEAGVQKLLGALNECNEWGQVFLLDALATVEPKSAADAERIVERVTARLSHANPAVVLSAVKVVMIFLPYFNHAEAEKAVCKKLTPPLVTLLSAEPEIVYVVLRNVNLIVQKRPQLLSNEVKMFFCKYNDPGYVKTEKIEIIIGLVSDKNSDIVLSELKEYATEVDVDFSRHAIKAICRVALKLPKANERCLQVYSDLLGMKQNHCVQEVVTCIKDIFRKYPAKYDSLLTALVDCVDLIEEPEAKAAMVWIVGEHADRIRKPHEILEQFCENFHDEAQQVQLQILTASVKLYLKMPAHQELVTSVLTKATEESDLPDLRDRGYIYWRMLSTNPDLTKHVVLGDRPQIEDESGLQPHLLDKLIKNISLMASVYHQQPDEFVTRVRIVDRSSDDEEDEEERRDRMNKFRDEIGKEKKDDDSPSPRRDGGGGGGTDLLGDLLDMGGPPSPPAAAAAQPPSGGGLDDLLGGMDLMGGGGGAAAPASTNIPKAVVFRADQPGQGGKSGLEISASVNRQGGAVKLGLSFTNRQPIPLNQWAIQLNKNPAGLTAGVLQADDCGLSATVMADVALQANPAMISGPLTAPLVLQVAVKTCLDIFYFTVPVDLSVILEEKAMDRQAYLQAWTALEPKQSGCVRRSNRQLSTDEVQTLLRGSSFTPVTTNTTEQADCAYFAGRFGDAAFYCEVALQRGGPMVRIAVRSDLPAYVPLVIAVCDRVLQLTPP